MVKSFAFMVVKTFKYIFSFPSTTANTGYALSRILSIYFTPNYNIIRLKTGS